MKASVHDTHRTEIYTGRPMRRWLAGWRWDVTALKCIIALPKTKMKPKHEDVEDEFHSQKEGFRGSMLVFQGCYILGCSPHLVIKSDHQDGMTFFCCCGDPHRRITFTFHSYLEGEHPNKYQMCNNFPYNYPIQCMYGIFTF